MNFYSTFCCDQGGREFNEDTVLIEKTTNALAFVVADGLGGHGCGKIASETAASSLANGFISNPQTDAISLQALFNQAELDILVKQTPICKMRSTVSCLFYNGCQMIFAHIGDSRIYRFRDGEIVFQSKDHSVSQMAVYAGEISQDQIRFHVDRNRVLRVLGGGEVRPEILSVSLPIAGEAFLLCTDGFWEYVDEKEMEIDLRHSSTPEGWLRKMLCHFRKKVSEKYDNFSAIAIFYC